MCCLELSLRLSGSFVKSFLRPIIRVAQMYSLGFGLGFHYYVRPQLGFDNQLPRNTDRNVPSFDLRGGTWVNRWVKGPTGGRGDIDKIHVCATAYSARVNALRARRSLLYAAILAATRLIIRHLDHHCRSPRSGRGKHREAYGLFVLGPSVLFGPRYAHPKPHPRRKAHRGTSISAPAVITGSLPETPAKARS